MSAPQLSIQLLVHATVAAGALLALWTFVRLGERSPTSPKAIVLHLALAIGLLATVPSLLDVVGGRSFSTREVVGALFVIFLPVMTYVFLTSLWLLGLLQRKLLLR